MISTLFKIMAIIILFITPLFAYEWIECGGDEDTSLVTSISPIDTIHGINIFAIYPEEIDSLGSDTLFTYMLNFGDTAGFTPGQILKKSSFNKLIFTFNVNPGFQNKFLILPHTRDEYLDSVNYDTIGYYTPNVQLMNLDLMAIADSVIDFADYDDDEDGYVDYISIFYRSFNLDMNDDPDIGRGWIGVPTVRFFDGSANGTVYYTTNDTNSIGNSIQIKGNDRGQTQRAAGGDFSYYHIYAEVVAHELSHNLSGGLFYYLDQWQGTNTNGYSFTASMFGVAFPSQGGRRCSYYQPLWAEKAGWLIEESFTELDEPIFAYPLGDYITTGSLCKFKASTHQWFLLANRQGLTLNEEHWPSKGLFIWHIDDSITGYNPQVTLEHKYEDLEIGDGLFVLSSDSTYLIASPDSGYDEIDFRWKYASDTTGLLELTGANYGDSGDAFVPSMDIVFDHTTNPNSNLYSYHDGKWYQDIPSHFSIRNLEADPSDSNVLIMDLLANHWYDSLTTNTTWGDTTKETGYAITGDFIIPAACTLTVLKGTNIYFQADDDDKAGGVSSSRCELIVYGTLIAEGDSANRIAFIPSSDQLGTAALQDWYGIRFMANSQGDLNYCDIEYCYYGIYMKDTSSVTVENCAFKNSYYSGIRNDKGGLYVNKCTFEDNNYGIISDHAKSEVDSSTFINNKYYGITVQYEPSYSLGASNIIGNTMRTGQDSILAGSYYGIRVYSIDDVAVEGNYVRTYGQGGIYLYNTDTAVDNNEVINCLYYGIYSTSSCDGLITYCDFDSLSYGIYLASSSVNTVNYCDFNTVNTGIRIYGNQQPDLGDSAAGDSTEWGNNDFENCGTYYIQQYASYNPGPLITAEMNYFGADGPKVERFSGNIDYTPYRTTDPLPKLTFERNLPLVYRLDGNYPNPFNPRTTISFSLAEPGYTSVTIYNILGQKIASPVSVNLAAGEHSIIWDGCNEAGDAVSSGIYFYRLQSGDFVDSKKMVLLR